MRETWSVWSSVDGGVAARSSSPVHQWSFSDGDVNTSRIAYFSAGSNSTQQLQHSIFRTEWLWIDWRFVLVNFKYPRCETNVLRKYLVEMRLTVILNCNLCVWSGRDVRFNEPTTTSFSYACGGVLVMNLFNYGECGVQVSIVKHCGNSDRAVAQKWGYEWWSCDKCWLKVSPEMSLIDWWLGL